VPAQQITGSSHFTWEQSTSGAQGPIMERVRRRARNLMWKIVETLELPVKSHRM
jgi:hypothetical protein